MLNVHHFQFAFGLAIPSGNNWDSKWHSLHRWSVRVFNNSQYRQWLAFYGEHRFLWGNISLGACGLTSVSTSMTVVNGENLKHWSDISFSLKIISLAIHDCHIIFQPRNPRDWRTLGSTQEHDAVTTRDFDVFRMKVESQISYKGI